jgi:hypothetical protein
MDPNRIFDYGIPYNIFTGFWSCICASYTEKGDFIGSTACHVGIYWAEPYSRIHFRQGESVDVPQVLKPLGLSGSARKIMPLEFDLEIVGKYAEGGAPGVKNVGCETAPDCYIFQISSGDSVWYNNQYCATANERLVIGPQLYKNQVQLMLSQRLMRISYDVPSAFRRPLRPLELE